MRVHNRVEVLECFGRRSSVDTSEMGVGLIVEANEVDVGVCDEVVRRELEGDRTNERLRSGWITGHCDGTERFEIEQRLPTGTQSSPSLGVGEPATAEPVKSFETLFWFPGSAVDGHMTGVPSG